MAKSSSNVTTLTKVFSIVEAILVIVCGILITIGYSKDLLNIMIGISFLLLGIDLLLIAVTLHRELGVGFGIGGAAAIGASICAFTQFVNFAGDIFNLLLVIGASVGVLLIVNCFILIARKMMARGIVQGVIGALLTTLCLLVLFVGVMQQLFWIFIGILVILVGVFMLVSVFVPSLTKRATK